MPQAGTAGNASQGKANNAQQQLYSWASTRGTKSECLAWLARRLLFCDWDIVDAAGAPAMPAIPTKCL